MGLLGALLAACDGTGTVADGGGDSEPQVTVPAAPADAAPTTPMMDGAAGTTAGPPAAPMTDEPVGVPPVVEPPADAEPPLEPPEVEQPAEPPAMAVPCGEGWGSDPIPGDVDLGLASSPEISGVPGGLPEERMILDQINEERVAAGLEPLIFSEQISNVARSHAADMNQLDYFDHGSSTRVYRDEEGTVIRDNWLPQPRLEAVYPGDFMRAGENIASFPDLERVVPAWMDSPGHRAAILDEYGTSTTHGGIGIDGRMVVFSPAVCR